MLVTLTTDFGDSAYAGALRGAILTVAPGARLVDLTHAIPPQDVEAGAFALLQAAPYFPHGTLHVGIVDPGVGTARRAVLVEAGGHLFLGPDNGLLVPAARALGPVRAREVANAALFRKTVSATFHGRDVFGPVAGHLANGVASSSVGPEIPAENLVQLPFGEARAEPDALVGRVVAVDSFGNLLTNVTESLARRHLRRQHEARIGTAVHTLPFVRTYADVGDGEPALLVGSSGFLEIAVNRGSAARLLGAGAGDLVVVRL